MKFRVKPLMIKVSEKEEPETWSGNLLGCCEEVSDTTAQMETPPQPKENPPQLSLLRDQLRQALQ